MKSIIKILVVIAALCGYSFMFGYMGLTNIVDKFVMGFILTMAYVILWACYVIIKRLL